MKSLNQESGEVSLVLIMLILVSLCLLGSVGFGVWAFGGRQNYKNNVDQIVAKQVGVARQQEDTAQQKIYFEKEKQPFRTFVSSSITGNVTVMYPKTWSVYAVDSGNGGSGGASTATLDSYFNPDTVLDTDNIANVFALHVQLMSQSYSSVMDGFAAQQQGGQVVIKPYKFAKVPSIVGVRIDGEIAPQKTGSMIVVPLRNEALEVSTQSQQFMNDFNNYILPNLSFSP